MYAANVTTIVLNPTYENLTYKINIGILVEEYDIYKTLIMLSRLIMLNGCSQLRYLVIFWFKVVLDVTLMFPDWMQWRNTRTNLVCGFVNERLEDLNPFILRLDLLCPSFLQDYKVFVLIFACPSFSHCRLNNEQFWVQWDSSYHFEHGEHALNLDTNHYISYNLSLISKIVIMYLQKCCNT